MDKKHKGGWAELVACSWLLHQGYEVFRNVSSHGLTDVVGYKEGLFVLFDVKCWSNRKAENGPRITERQANVGVVGLWVKDDGSCVIDGAPKVLFQPQMRECRYCLQQFSARKSVAKFCTSWCRTRFHSKKEVPDGQAI